MESQTREMEKIEAGPWLKGEAFSLTPKTLEEAMKFAEMIANSSMVPPSYKGKPGDVLVAIQMGMEVGLKPLQALQNIATINGRPCIWGDAALALVQASGKLDWIEETCDGKTATCSVKRKGYPETTVRTFSTDDAKKAGLLGKAGPWTQYEKRMLQMRARGFALRDTFADALKGLIIAEEAQDYDVIHQNVGGEKGVDLVRPRKLAEPLPETPKAIAEPVAPAAIVPEPTEKPSEEQNKTTFVPVDVVEKQGIDKNGKPFLKWGISHPDGRIFGTFEKDHGDIAARAKEMGYNVKLTYKQAGKYLNVVEIVLVEGDAQD